jgi:hypothetical protein
MNNMRRTLLMAVAAGSAVLSWTAQAQGAVDENGAPALAVGYVADAINTDIKKFPWYSPGQNCSSCISFQGKAGDAAGGCPLFTDKLVAGKGWCSAWTKKG